MSRCKGAEADRYGDEGMSEYSGKGSNMRMMMNSRSSSSYWWGDGGSSEIEIEIEEEQGGGGGLDTILEVEGSSSSLFSFDFHNGGGEAAVYVAVRGNDDQEESAAASMDALRWTLNHHPITLTHPSSALVFLVHVFPEIKHIPTPLGMMPVSQVNPEQKENYMAQERGKRREFLNKFLNVCSSAKVKVDTILIESDMEAKAILDLIPVLNVRKLVLGTTKAQLRKMKSRRTSGTIDQILKGAPEFCEVKIICEGKEALDLLTTDSPSPSPSPSPRPANIISSPRPAIRDNRDHHVTTSSDSFRCGCFKPKVNF